MITDNVKKYVLFDLDGTLTDSKEGITKSVQYALKEYGIEESDLDKLNCFIGPPLFESFKMFYDLNDEDASFCVEKYRERFTVTGIYENLLYEGIPDVLEKLKNAGFINVLATAKPEVFAVRILDYFHIDQYFDVITGSDLHGEINNKSKVIGEAVKRLMQHLSIPYIEDNIIDVKSDCIMIGDRKDDVAGAQNNMIECMGVRYGFAQEGELEDAGADYIVNEVKDILTALV